MDAYPTTGARLLSALLDQFWRVSMLCGLCGSFGHRLAACTARRVVELTAGPVRGGWCVAAPRVVRVAPKTWRGENHGRKGDRLVVRMPQWDR